MLDLTINQLAVIREALQLLADTEREGNRSGIAASKLADQVEIVIAARKAETVAPQGTMHVELKGR